MNDYVEFLKLLDTINSGIEASRVKPEIMDSVQSVIDIAIEDYLDRIISFE